MAVMILDMAIPENCYDCDFNYDLQNCMAGRIIFEREFEMTRVRHPKCPLVDVVRCRDCVNYETDWQPTGVSKTHFCGILDYFPKPDFFCSRGDRRKE